MVKHDVIIVGGGVAGLVLAVDLLQAGLSIAVIEARELSPSKPQQHVRVSAINIASERILSRLQVWEKISVTAKSPFRMIKVCDAEGNAAVDFSYRDVLTTHLGHIVANQAIVSALLAQAKSYANFTWICPNNLSTFAVADNVTVKCADGQSHQAKLLVAADGSKSTVRQLLQIPLQQASYEQHAVVTTVQTELAHNHVAWQRFLRTGPLAFLPLTNPHQCSIVWSTTPAHAEQLLAQDVAMTANEFIQATLNQFGQIQLIESLQSFPLQMQHAQQYVHHRVALIGDAAHTIHPLAGQGMNLGIMDAACLSEVLIASQQANRDIGRVENLRPYERWRRGDNQSMIDAMALFKSGFVSENSWIQTFRNLGLSLTRASPWLRSKMMLQAMGLRGELPQLAKQ